jgi:hypothetical protein
MTFTRTTIAALATMVTLGAAGARAQERAQELALETPRQRQGYYVGGVLRALSTQAREDGASFGPWPGMSYGLRLGQLLTSRLGLGLSIDLGGTQGDKKQSGFFGALAIEGSIAVIENLALTASSGLGLVGIKDPDDPDDPDHMVSGAAYGLGVTWDWFPGSRTTGGFSISPTLQARFIPAGDDRALGVMVGVDFLWWTGLPRNQLQLPDAEAYGK